jgi:hypothetical protein
MTQMTKKAGTDLMRKAIESTALAEIDDAVLGFTDEMIGRGADITQRTDLGPFRKAFGMAGAITMLRQQITEQHMGLLMPLQNSAMGFLTDNKGGYPVEVVKECVIEAVLRGFAVTGNEFNIISGRFYATKNGLARKVREFPGLTDLRLNLGVPEVGREGQVVDARATWRLNGKADELARLIPVKVNAGMGPDAILGKATRKLLASVYGVLTGSEHTVPEGEVGDVREPRVALRAEPLSPTGALAAVREKAQEAPPEPETRRDEPDEPPADDGFAATFAGSLDVPEPGKKAARTPRPR